MSSVLHESFKYRSKKYCDAKKILESTLYPERFKIDQGTCWLCWMRLTGQELASWRREPYYERGMKHKEECPVCGYNHWIGAVWYPFRYLQEKGKIILGNPSFRREKSARTN